MDLLDLNAVVHIDTTELDAAIEKANQRRETMKYTFDDYWDALEGAGPRLKEIVLERAAHDDGIDFPELKRLCDKAYPDA